MSATPQSFNPEQFKALQRQMWDNVAKGWETWWQTIERGAQKVSDKLVELAEIKPGDRVLDIATGIGEPAVTAAKRVKPGGKVVATDISPQMIAIAKSRAKSLGLDNVMEFGITDAEKLDFPKSSFNAVLSRWGLMFLPNLPVALTTIRQLLVPGGRFAAAVWSAPTKVPMLDLAFSTVRKEINAPTPPVGTPGPFALADSEALKRSFSQAGFSDIRVQTIYITIGFDSAEGYTRFQQQITAPIHAMLASQADEKKKQVWEAVTAAVGQYADSHGRVNLDNEVICIVGKS
ncbi:class I SAM-dependent methyltransferase [Nitrososphaera sp.]|uniref:class I SAM-dependent methyltransferase n=1 Tax=Nitrososphaera sp. TaxID=1971748 RepID=UPI002ED8BDC7